MPDDPTRISIEDFAGREPTQDSSGQVHGELRPLFTRFYSTTPLSERLEQPERICQDCGFLALRRLTTQELVEAPKTYRDEAIVPLRGDLSHREDTQRFPVCSKQQRDFIDEHTPRRITAAIPNIQPHEMLKMLATPYRCGFFTEYRQGWSPKEHQEMLDRQWKIEQEILVREAVWAREDDRDTRVEKQHEDQMKLLRDQHTEQTGLLKTQHTDQMGAMETQHKSELHVFGWIVTGAIVGSTLLAAIIQAGWINPPLEWW